MLYFLMLPMIANIYFQSYLLYERKKYDEMMKINRDRKECVGVNKQFNMCGGRGYMHIHIYIYKLIS